MFNKVQKGFTLIELMIVVAIIGILAAIAIPAYQNYTIRAQVTEGLTLADGYKTAIAEYYANHGSMPNLSNLTGVSAAVGKYESNISVTGGEILITYGGAVNATISGKILGLSPWLDANSDVLWQCGSAGTPATGATIASGATTSVTATTVSAQYLPSACHS